MTIVALATVAHMVDRFTEATVLEHADDAGTNDVEDTLVVARLESRLVEASAVAYAIMRVGWTSAQVQVMAAEDPSIVGAVCDIAIDLCARRRSQWINEDKETLWTQTRRMAEKHLKLCADTLRRPEGEDAAGSNRKIAFDVNKPARVGLMFSDTRANPKGRMFW